MHIPSTFLSIPLNRDDFIALLLSSQVFFGILREEKLIMSVLAWLDLKR